MNITEEVNNCREIMAKKLEFWVNYSTEGQKDKLCLCKFDPNVYLGTCHNLKLGSVNTLCVNDEWSQNYILTIEKQIKMISHTAMQKNNLPTTEDIKRIEEQLTFYINCSSEIKNRILRKKIEAIDLIIHKYEKDKVILHLEQDHTIKIKL